MKVNELNRKRQSKYLEMLNQDKDVMEYTTFLDTMKNLRDKKLNV